MTALARPPAATPSHPRQIWRTLAPLISAPGRRTMRLYNAETGKFSDTGRRSDALPTRPAAVYLYTTKGRTTVLALDFDAAHGDVDTDLATAADWITRCGGVIVTDRSPTGGRHLLCPLAIGTTASASEISHLVRLLGARLPSLDITPNTNPDFGCLSVPGTPGKRGGYRTLDGPLQAAVNAFTTRSAPALLPRLYELLGAIKPRTTTPPERRGATPTADPVDTYCTGHGPERRLSPAYIRDDAMHPDLTTYAQHGTMPTGQRQWRSHSEARMAVLTAAIARGHSLASLTTMSAPGGPWERGLGTAYTRYRHAAGSALERDFHHALNWLCTNVLKHRHPQHKKKYSQGGSGGSGPRGPLELRGWLANALRWADTEYRGHRYRWTVHAVLQALAWSALAAGERINGVWVVGVGGRSLALATGLLSEDAVWRVLRDLRDREGAPLVLTRSHIGVDADAYALTMQNPLAPESAADRVRVEPVHDAWSVLGHHRRRIYELIAYHGMTNRADIYAAVAVSRSTGDEIVRDLETAGLVARTGRGTVGLGTASLDGIAAAHHTETTREERVTRYRDERDQWRAWLTDREQQREAAEQAALEARMPAEHPDVDRTFWAAVMATGPPAAETDNDVDAIDLCAEILGARILTATVRSPS
ncbi:hypothetical protein [Mycolicibacterium sp. CBMA 226]|uniref:hypothetical protein n=1 Tax=Mycolicibacterium sp. CBMA 226 TaxID=2606611 RepID=UPI0013199A89|nr:hypothetical protein [Mycolicibacterium sp. CBMA 226]QGW61250.1 hypothetical protein ICEMyc226_00218 [Mycolicibacterium sp.]